MLIYIIQLNIIKLKYFFKKMTKISQAFIFAAGRGQRMRPFTDTTPKPLAPVCGQPLLQHILDHLSKYQEIDNIVINGYYLAEQVADFVASQNNPKLQFSEEFEQLETAGGLIYASNDGKFNMDEPLLLINSDIFWQNDDRLDDISDLFNHFEGSCSDIALGLLPSDRFFGYFGNGDYNFDAVNNQIISSGKLTHVFTGIAVINPNILTRYNEKKSFSMGYFYNNYQDLGLKLTALEFKNQYFHIGDTKTLEAVNNLL